MDLRRKRSENTRHAILAALERLQKGTGNHAGHLGIKVRITKQSVAREARISSATLYRYPDLVRHIALVAGAVHEQTARPSEQRRLQLTNRIAELERRIAALLAENVRLTRMLAGSESSDADRTTVDFSLERQKRRNMPQHPVNQRDAAASDDAADPR